MTQPSEVVVEAAAKAVYELEPIYESGEYVDGFQVSPGGNLTWGEVKARDAEFGGDASWLSMTKIPYDIARAAIRAAYAVDFPEEKKG